MKSPIGKLHQVLKEDKEQAVETISRGDPCSNMGCCDLSIFGEQETKHCIEELL